MKIENVMTRRVVAARADTDLAHVARLMWDNDCGCVPVVDAEDKVVGILTDRDAFIHASHQGRALRELRAGACMASEVLACLPSDSVIEVAKCMGARRVRRVPVVDEGGRLVGLVSAGDLLCAAAAAAPKDKKALQAALVEALTTICAHPAHAEVAPATPAKKPAAAKPSKSLKPHKPAKAPKAAKSGAKKRARV